MKGTIGKAELEAAIAAIAAIAAQAAADINYNYKIREMLQLLRLTMPDTRKGDAEPGMPGKGVAK